MSAKSTPPPQTPADEPHVAQTVAALQAACDDPAVSVPTRALLAQACAALQATAAEARMLGEGKGCALLTMQRTAYDDHGTVVEYGNHIYSAARYSFHMSLLSI